MIHRIAITPGEPAGIGPDICGLLSSEPPENTELVVISDTEILKERAKQLGISLSIKSSLSNRIACLPHLLAESFL